MTYQIAAWILGALAFSAGTMALYLLAKNAKLDMAKLALEKDLAAEKLMHTGVRTQIEALQRERDRAVNEYKRIIGLHNTLKAGDVDHSPFARDARAAAEDRRREANLATPLHVGGFAVTELADPASFFPDTQVEDRR